MTVSAQCLGVHVSYVAAGAHSLLLLITCQRNLTLLVILLTFFSDVSKPNSAESRPNNFFCVLMVNRN